jgi:RNA polymerase sigma-70 factor (ECF subfamily)
MSNLIDSYLLFRIRTKRDPEAFARIYDRYVEAIFRFAILKLPSREEAQDVTAETFTRAWQYVSQNAEIGNIRAILYRIARNLIADHYRKQHGVLSLEAVTSSPDSTSSRIEEPGDRGREQVLVEARADLALVLRQLERLKEDYRDVLTLRLVDGLPFSVIAEVLEKTPGNVRVIYHRALKALHDTETTTT